jgi:threonine aldolase
MLGRYTTGPRRGVRISEPPAVVRWSTYTPRSMADHVIDLRSDTVSRPTDAMRRVMSAATVGDDVLGDDPTVIALEERAADLLGKEAGLFVSSGTQGNLVSQMAHLQRGQETIAGKAHHMVIDEAAGHAVVVGASIRSLDDRADGTLDLAEIEAAFRNPLDPHEPITGLITLENTHAHSMARPLPPAYIEAVGAIARRHGVALHIDGARFWNAVVAQRPAGVTARDLAGPADTVTFCLSKGLGCPVGSVVVGSKDVIWRARRARKLLGGGMRQAGVIAAAGLLALQDGEDGMIDRLADDHANARRLAEGITDLAGIHSPGGLAQPDGDRLDPDRIASNFVLFKVDREHDAFLAALRARNVLMVEYFYGQLRAATHHDVSRDDIDTTIAAVRDALTETRPMPEMAAATA